MPYFAEYVMFLIIWYMLQLIFQSDLYNALKGIVHPKMKIL